MILTTILLLYAGCCLAILNNTEDQKKSLKITKFFDFDEEDINDLSHDDKSIDTPLKSKLNADSFNPVELDYGVYDDLPTKNKDNDEAETQYENYAMERNSDESYPEAEQRDYGHSSEGYSEHGTGYTVPTKKPGPYGYPTPNYKCEKSSETLYVTETEWTYDTKCFNVYKVKCTEGYDEGKVGKQQSKPNSSFWVYIQFNRFMPSHLAKHRAPPPRDSWCLLWGCKDC